MDAMLSMDMPKPPQSYPSLLWGRTAANFYLRYLLNYIPKTLPYCSAYPNSSAIRGICHGLTVVQNGLFGLDGDQMDSSIWNGNTDWSSHIPTRDLITSYMLKHPPGLVSHLPRHDWSNAAEHEADLLMQIVGEHHNGSSRIAWYYMYPKMAVLFGAAGRNGLGVSRFVNQGPFADIWSSHIPVMEGLLPKQSLKAFIRKYAGRSYNRILETFGYSTTTGSRKPQPPNFECLIKYRSLLDPATAPLPQLCSGRTADTIATWCRDLLDLLDRNAANRTLDPFVALWILRIVNVSKLLQG